MKEIFKKKHLLLPTLFLFITVFSTAVCAAQKPYVPTEPSTYAYQTENADHNGVGLIIQNATKNVSVKKLKSSNASVVKASWSKKQYDIISIDYFKPGKATISGVLYQGSKKLQKFKIKVNVIKYESPVASFKLGSKNYASKFSGASQYYLNYSGTKKYKVKIKPKSGWELDWIEFLDSKKNVRTIKNGSTVTCKTDWHYINVFFTEKKSGRSQSVIMYIQK